MNPATLILAAVFLPLAACPLIALAGSRPNLREAVTLAAGVLTFGAVLQLLPLVAAGERPGASLMQVLPGIELAFEVEPLGMLFAMVASGLWIVTSCYSIGYMRGHRETSQTRFFLFFAVAVGAALAVAFARNLFTLFLAYEVLTFSTYPLVTHARTPAARRGGRIYLGILLGTSFFFLLPALLWTWHLTGTLEFSEGGILAGSSGPAVAGLLLLYAFGTGKAALIPFHRWLPAAMVAPAPVSALLHAVAVVKAGVFTVLKVLVYVFGLDLLRETSASVWLMYAAGATVLIASLAAMTKDNLKARLAYSTVSQLSYIILGGALASSWGIVGGGMHIAMHAFGKITLFFCAGAIDVALHRTEISDMRGIGRQMPVTMSCFLVGALSVIGLPPLGGAWSKWYLALGAVDAGQLLFLAVLMVSTLLNIAYLMPIPIRAFFPRGEPAPARGTPSGAGAASSGAEAATGSGAESSGDIREAPAFMLAPICFTALGCLVLFFCAGGLYRLLLPLAGR